VFVFWFCGAIKKKKEKIHRNQTNKCMSYNISYRYRKNRMSNIFGQYHGNNLWQYKFIEIK